MQALSTKAIIRGVVSAACMCVTSIPALAVGSTGKYSVYFADMPLSVALSVIGRDLGIDFSTDGIGRARIRDVELSGTPSAVIDGLMEEAGMQAFAFNGQTFVSPADESEVRLIQLTNLRPEHVFEALEEAGLLFPEYDITQVAGGKAMVFSGPIKYLALSESVIASLEAKPIVAETPVRVRRAGRLDSDRVGTVSEQTAAE
jgi:type II secretory pathway component GspD/PulD (secretin)